MGHKKVSKFRYLFFVIILIPKLSIAGFITQWSFFYNTIFPLTENPVVNSYAYSKMDNAIFAGASIGRSAKLFLGPSYHLWNNSYQPSSSDTARTLSFTNFGASLLYFFDIKKRWKLELNYSPSVNGTRVLANGTEEILTGNSYRVGFGYHRHFSKLFVLGFTVYYHSISITDKVIGTTETKITDTYSGVLPMVELSFRTK